MKKKPDECKDCAHSHSCSEIYEKLGKSGSESVTTKVCIAFLVPMLVFIIVLWLSDKHLKHAIEKQSLRGILSLIISVAAAFVVTFMCRYVYGKISKKSSSCKDAKP